MTEEEFAAGIDAILLTGGRDHQTHRALDLWWTRYAMELPHDSLVRAATIKWMAAIEGHHTPGKPYPLGRRWWQFWKPKRLVPISTDSEVWNLTCP